MVLMLCDCLLACNVDCSQTAPKPLPNCSQTSPKPLPNLSQTAPKLLPNLSQTAPKPLPNCSQTAPKLLPNLSQTAPKPLPNCSQTGSNKVSNLAILTFYFIAFGFPRAIKLFEPISVRLVNVIWEFLQHTKTGNFARNSYHKFAKRLFA